MFKTKRLFIRPARTDDTQLLHAVYSDPQTMRYWDSLPDQTLEQTARRVRGMTAALSPSYFVLELEDVPIGNAGIHSGDEIGFILHRDHWRRGLMSEALEAIIPWCFAHLGLQQITADADPRNEGSLAILTRFGFQETGRAARTIQVGDEWCDSVYLRLPRP